MSKNSNHSENRCYRTAGNWYSKILAKISEATALFYGKSNKNKEFHKSEETMSDNNTTRDSLQNNPSQSTPQLVFNILKSFGCQPKFKDKRTLTVSYQGEQFHFDFGQTPSQYIRIWDPWWGAIKTDDPHISLAKEALNVTNFNFGPTIVMTSLDEDNDVTGFHSRYDIMIHPACPDNDKYLKTVLDSFFSAKENLRKNFHNLDNKQPEQHRYLVSFSTSQHLNIKHSVRQISHI